MSQYELLLILPGTLDDKQATERSEEILKLVEAGSSKATMTIMGKNRLAYPIRQIRYGYFYSLVFTAESSAVVALQKKFSLMRDLLRAVVSHFKVAAVVNQPISYSADTILVTTPEARDGRAVERTIPTYKEKLAEPVSEEISLTTPAQKASAVARDIEKLDMEEINKKLDDLMSGDVIPGV